MMLKIKLRLQLFNCIFDQTNTALVSILNGSVYKTQGRSVTKPMQSFITKTLNQLYTLRQLANSRLSRELQQQKINQSSLGSEKCDRSKIPNNISKWLLSLEIIR